MIIAMAIGTKIVETLAKPRHEHRENNADCDEAPRPRRRDDKAVGD